MAFPTGYTKYQEITIDHTKVDADLTDYVVYVDLANLVKTGADIFDSCRTDGGDIRATKSDGTTQLATELVAIDTTAKTGELHIKFSGTLSGSSSTIIRIYYNGSDTALAVTDTYGRNAVWSNYVGVWHFNESSGNATDSTGNGNTLTAINSAGYTASGKLGRANSTNGTNQRFDSSGAMSLTNSGVYSWTLWAKSTNVNSYIFDHCSPTGGNTRYMCYYDTTNKITTYFNGGAVSSANNSISANTWHKITLVKTGANSTPGRFYLNGAHIGNANSSTAGSATAKLSTNGSVDGGSWFNGNQDEVRVRTSEPAATWESTEYNNQNSPSTFYSVGDEAGGGVTVSGTTPALTLSIPAYSISTNVVYSASAQVVTLSQPVPSVALGATADAATQSVTLNMPPYTVLAGGDTATIVNTQVITASIPAYSAFTDVVAAGTTQEITMSTIAPSVTAEASVIVTATTQVLTLAMVALLKAGGSAWTRQSRNSTGTWTRSSRNST